MWSLFSPKKKPVHPKYTSELNSLPIFDESREVHGPEKKWPTVVILWGRHSKRVHTGNPHVRLDERNEEADHGTVICALPFERRSNRPIKDIATAPHLDSTQANIPDRSTAT